MGIEFESMTEAATSFVDHYKEGTEIPGGLSYQKALSQSRLDGSLESFRRIDFLLDQIRGRQKPSYEQFLAHQKNINFLYLLGFYVGVSVATMSDSPVHWISYEQLLAANPSTAEAWPRRFESSAVCVLQKSASGQKMFMPLVPIVVRLFEGPEKSSVLTSASIFL